MKQFGLLAMMLVAGIWCHAQQGSPNSYVNPLVGTHKMGHTYPGATVPFGAVQLSPETDTLPYEVDGQYNKDVYKYCAGYQYADSTIVGFSHTHFSGTGHSDLGDILLMPTTGPLHTHPGTAARPADGYRSPYRHSTEVAEPGYYRVLLDRYNIEAELTTTTRVGVHRYRFPATDSARILLDLVYGIYNYPDKNVWSFVRVENDTLVTGYRQTNGWGRTRTVYFAMTFSRPIRSYGWQNESKKQVYRGFWRKWNQEQNFPEMAGTQLRGWFGFDMANPGDVIVKVGISPVSTANALQNLREEVPHNNFDRVRQDAREQWLIQLSAINIDADDEVKKNFYTALYHTLINPTVYIDRNGQYRGLDQNVHTTNSANYTTFSLWDTYRALHPLFNIICPERNGAMVQSMLHHYDQSVHHMLPIWSHYANENWCMIGYHAASVVADAVVKGTGGFDAQHALDACVATARHRSFEGLGYYMDMGYVPEDKSGASVSKTLEYAYDDWAIAQMARKLNRMDVYGEFARRAGNYRNVFDSSTGFMRPRLSNGAFRTPFNTLNTDEPGFIEGNSWNYSLYVPHEPEKMIALMGGNKRFAQHLDSLFTMQLPDSFFAHTEDVTREGIIGNYVHGNEPSHHVAYLYNHCGTPWKTQERVRMIMKKMYHPTPDGLSGNDDCGQMSAWYIFSALGFYPIAPGSDRYELGSPAVHRGTVRVGGIASEKFLTIIAKNQGDKNVYVQKVTLNGQPLNRTWITHDEIMNGGTLTFTMGSRPRR